MCNDVPGQYDGNLIPLSIKFAFAANSPQPLISCSLTADMPMWAVEKVVIQNSSCCSWVKIFSCVSTFLNARRSCIIFWFEWILLFWIMGTKPETWCDSVASATEEIWSTWRSLFISLIESKDVETICCVADLRLYLARVTAPKGSWMLFHGYDMYGMFMLLLLLVRGGEDTKYRT